MSRLRNVSIKTRAMLTFDYFRTFLFPAYHTWWKFNIATDYLPFLLTHFCSPILSRVLSSLISIQPIKVRIILSRFLILGTLIVTRLHTLPRAGDCQQVTGNRRVASSTKCLAMRRGELPRGETGASWQNWRGFRWWIHCERKHHEKRGIARRCFRRLIIEIGKGYHPMK